MLKVFRNAKLIIAIVVSAIATATAVQDGLAQQGSHPGRYGSQYGATVCDRAPPPCTADGYCTPRTVTWGYYQGRWRRWPIGLEEARPGAGVAIPPALQPYKAPPPEEEDERTPAPPLASPTPGDVPPVDRPMPEGAPMPDATPVPNAMPVPDAMPVPSATPAPARSSSLLEPSTTFNPFQVRPSSLLEDAGSERGENSASPLEQQDPPPPLPSSLWSLRQKNAAALSARIRLLTRTTSTEPRVARLPSPGGNPSVRTASAVQPASAVVPATTGTAADQTAADRAAVLPAVHFAPVDADLNKLD